jgi:hypothetical protein
VDGEELAGVEERLDIVLLLCKWILRFERKNAGGGGKLRRG